MTPTASPGSILYVDDDESIRIAVSMALMAEGYDVQTAPDGAAALALLGESMPVLILLDMRMPVMDGPAFMQKYLARSGPHVPVIALTAARSTEDVPVMNGISDVLVKPFHLSELLNAVEQQLAPG